MNDENDNIHRLPTARQPSGNGPRDSDFGERLARLEEKVASIKENMATGKDISDLKVWILGGVLSAIIIAATIATVIVKGFFSA